MNRLALPSILGPHSPVDLSAFGHDPLWLIVAKAVAVFAFLVLTVLSAILIERKVMARMQHRYGPNRLGPFGILQSLADGIKLALKEGITPSGVDKPVYLLAPIIATVPAFLAFAVIPFGPEVSVFGTRTPLQLTDLPVAVLYVLAITSIGVYGIVLAGWSSGSTYPLLGGLRSTAQVISYEVAMGLSFAAVFLYAGTMATSGIVTAQDGTWYVFLLMPSFAVYVVSMVGETNRAPFDLPEAEGELVGGFHTEYSSLAFAMFMLAEYVNMTTVSALATTLFLGGWHAPWPLNMWDGANTGWWPAAWFVGKVWCFMFMFIWLRTTLPRLRYDQFMRFGWQLLIPTALVWVLVAGGVQAWALAGHDTTVLAPAASFAFTLAVLAVLVLRHRRQKAPSPAPERATISLPFDPMAGGFPVPPLPGQYVPEPARRALPSEHAAKEVSRG